MISKVKKLVRQYLPSRYEPRVTRRVRDVEVGAFTMYLALKNRLSKKCVQEREDRPIVSLTSFPARLDTVYLTIESILRQSAPPASIYLWLYEGEISYANLPVTLRRLEKRGLHIEFVPDNLRGAKKLVYAARRLPDRVIVTADDDVLYPKDWLSKLIVASRESPGTVVCHRGHAIKRRPDGEFYRYWDCMSHDSGGAAPSYHLLPTGVGGVLYPPRVLHSQVFDIELMNRLCPIADDVWFKAMTLLKGVKSRRVGEKNFMPVMIPGSQEQALIHENKYSNDGQIEKTFSYFDLKEYFPREILRDA